MKTVIYPGSFDPVTYGHLDIIERALRLSDRLVVAILNNSAKQPMFTVEERMDMLRQCTAGLARVEVTSFSGLTVEFAKQKGAVAMVRGLRAVTDFEYELQLSQINRKLSEEVDTIFLTTSLKYAYLSSSTVKEVASYGGDISEFVPPYVMERIYEKIKK